MNDNEYSNTEYGQGANGRTWRERDRMRAKVRRTDAIATPKARRRQARRYITPPEPPKPCMVYWKQFPMFYVKVGDTKFLTRKENGDYTEFPSHVKARAAIWHTIQYLNRTGLVHADGEPFHSKEFALVDC